MKMQGIVCCVALVFTMSCSDDSSGGGGGGGGPTLPPKYYQAKLVVKNDSQFVLEHVILTGPDGDYRNSSSPDTKYLNATPIPVGKSLETMVSTEHPYALTFVRKKNETAVGLRAFTTVTPFSFSDAKAADYWMSCFDGSFRLTQASATWSF